MSDDPAEEETLSFLTSAGMLRALPQNDIEQHVFLTANRAIQRRQVLEERERLEKLEKELQESEHLFAYSQSVRQRSRLKERIQEIKQQMDDTKRRLRDVELLEKDSEIQLNELDSFQDTDLVQSTLEQDSKAVTPEPIALEESVTKKQKYEKQDESDNDEYNVTEFDELLDDNNEDGEITTFDRKTQWCDDSDDKFYYERLAAWQYSHYETHFLNEKELDQETRTRQLDKVAFLKHSNDFQLDGTVRAPAYIWDRLFPYQRDGLKWMTTLHGQQVGGLLGDEAGTGKTCQVLSFLGSLHASRALTGPVLVVCPVTVLRQWVEEAREWAPALRCIILHKASGGETLTARVAIDRTVRNGNILLTSYAGLVSESKRLLNVPWSYVVLDEGHHIRNPDAKVTLVCKQLNSVHRLLLSGTPIQNNLVELWSLFDFIYPGRLGTLPVFQSQFALPIQVGGYAHASSVQVETAYRCACALRDLISPYLLRRIKADVAPQLPRKSEQVLFCQLTPFQRELYEAFLSSRDMSAILDGKKHVLYGIDLLRKICNHPDLVASEMEFKEAASEGDKSGKIKVLLALLALWHRQKHRVLLFCQTRQMLDIIERYVRKLQYNYQRLDGATPPRQRMVLINEFNENENVFCFLLTTRVGGLGINLTGADRVLLYDPDWNPSTDTQARERAWRLGQKRQVHIYRLITSGTIEEKVYHRQIFKQFLTNKILSDPKQTRFFKTTDLYDLFTLAPQDAEGTETRDYLLKGLDREIERALNGKASKSSKSNELQAIDGLDRVDDYQAPESKSHHGASSSTSVDKTAEERLLDDIFDRTGVKDTLRHDRFVDRVQPDRQMVEREAQRLADEAVQALRLSREMRMKAARTEPTWTGRFGTAGKNSKPNALFDGQALQQSDVSLSSRDLLANLKKHQAASSSTASSSTSRPVTALASSVVMTAAPSSDLLLATAIRNHLAKQSHISTESIVTAFKHRIQGQEATSLFRKILKQLAILDKKTSTWQLRPEFS